MPPRSPQKLSSPPSSSPAPEPQQLRQGKQSFLQRPLWAGMLLLGLLVVVVALSLTQGAVSLSGSELWQAALRQGEATHQTIL